MEINDKSLEVLSAGLKIDKEKLTEALKSGELDLSDRVIYTTDEFKTYETNLKNQEYHNGKKAGNEMPLKQRKENIAKNFGIDVEGIKSHDELDNLIVDYLKNDYEDKYKGNLNENKKKFIDEIEQLKTKNKELKGIITEKETEFNSKLAEQMQQIEKTAIDRNLSDLVNALPFDIPKSVAMDGKEAEMKYLQIQRDKVLTLFKSKYAFERQDGKLIIKDGDKVIQNNLLDPETPENVLLGFAKDNFIQLKDNKVINRSDSEKYGNVSYAGSTLEQFNEHMEKKGIKPHMTEYVKQYGEWQKANK